MPLTPEDLQQVRKIVNEVVTESAERILTFTQAGFARVDQRFDEVNARFDAQAVRLDMITPTPQSP